PATIDELTDVRGAAPLAPDRLLDLLRSGPPVFSLLFGTEGEDGAWQGVAEVFDLEGNFGAVDAAAVTMHKLAFAAAATAIDDRVAAPLTVPVPAPASAEDCERALERLGGRPCVVKPNAMGASLLLTHLPAPTAADLREAIAAIAPHDRLALVQEHVAGDEYTVGVFEDRDGPRALPPLRAVFDRPVLGHAEKHRPGQVTGEWLDGGPLADLLAGVSVRLFGVLGLRLWCRLDYLWSPDRGLVVLEANSMPGLMRGSAYPLMLEAAGLTLGDLLDANLALRRDARSKRLPYEIHPHDVSTLDRSVP
ncbi:MAG TPA: hypothetical protein VF587_12020, partial [Solirubrobacteraceae bacterium]